MYYDTLMRTLMPMLLFFLAAPAFAQGPVFNSIIPAPRITGIGNSIAGLSPELPTHTPATDFATMELAAGPEPDSDIGPSGSGPDQVNESSTLENAVHTSNYRCDRTGSADATRCINDAMAATPTAGVLVIDPGTYKIAGAPHCFGKSITVFSYGATFNFTSTGKAFCTNDLDAHQYGTTTPYQLKSAAFAAAKVFTITASEAAHFPSGTPFWIKGTPSNKDSYYDVSIGNNPSTGEIDLNHPLPKNIVAPAKIYNVTGQNVTHFYWYGGTFNDPSGTPLNISQTQFFRFQDQKYRAATQIANGSMVDGTFDHIDYETCDNGAFDAENASNRVIWSYSIARCPNPGTRGPLALVNVAEGSTYISFDHCLMDHRNYTGTVDTINVSLDANFVSFTNNWIYSNSPSAVALFGGMDGILNNPSFASVEDNYIWGPVTGINDSGGWTELNIAHNHVFVMDAAGNGNGSAIQVTSPGDVSGNYAYGPVGIYVFYANVTNAGPNIMGNTIYGWGTHPNDYGIVIGDPGNIPPDPDATIIGNAVRSSNGKSHLIQYYDVSHVPNIVVQGNSGIINRPRSKHTVPDGLSWHEFQY